MRRVWRSPYAPISIHAPLAGCDLGFFARQKYGFSISIHAPLAGCDAGYHARNWQKHDFNPRTPCGVRRKVANYFGVTVEISIHAPLAGCDSEIVSVQPTAFNFNPRTPCGVRLVTFCPIAPSLLFQSTHPLRGATYTVYLLILSRLFQSTHPLRGATSLSEYAPTPSIFQSTHPLRGATFSIVGAEHRKQFQSTHPLRGATGRRPRGHLDGNISIHAPLAGCDAHRRPAYSA